MPVTAIRDRQSDPDADDDFTVPWDELPVVGTRRGLPWWGAVLLGFGLAALGAVASLQITDNLELIFQGAYFVGAVGAVAAVQRRSLFGPMVQPPLILAVTVPAALLFSGTPTGDDKFSTALAIATPLINGFPTMAITTGAALALGFYRVFRERDPDPPMKPVKSGKSAASGKSGKSAASKEPRPAEAARPPAKARPRPADDDAPAPRRPARPATGATRDPARSSRETPPRRPASGGASSTGTGAVRRRPADDPPRRREPLDREPRKRTPPPTDGKPARRTPPPPRTDTPRDRTGRPPSRRTPPQRPRPWDEDRD
ncbi:hypothetical protein GCM10027199_64530 [Amycolatopsis magusensis]